MHAKKRLTGLLFTLIAITIAGIGMRGVNTGRQSSTGANEKLIDLTSLASLEEAFNQDEGKVRIVTLLSPSCSYCIKGYRYMLKIFDEVEDGDLRMYVVWMPILSGDSRELADRMRDEAEDGRIVFQYWDEARISGRAFRDEMAMEGVAWDVYYLYGPDSVWDESAPTRPDYWEHQLSELDPERHLSYDSFKGEVLDMLSRGG